MAGRGFYVRPISRMHSFRCLSHQRVALAMVHVPASLNRLMARFRRLAIMRGPFFVRI